MRAKFSFESKEAASDVCPPIDLKKSSNLFTEWSSSSAIFCLSKIESYIAIKNTESNQSIVPLDKKSN